MAVECYICLEGCKAPSCPPCGHVFCRACIEAYILAQRNGGGIKCPVCKEKFDVDVSSKWYLPRRFHKLRESPSLRRLYTSDSDIGSSTVELQTELDRAKAVERELKEVLELRLEERNRRVAILEEEAKNIRLQIVARDNKLNRLAFCVVVLGVLLVDLGVLMFTSKVFK